MIAIARRPFALDVARKFGAAELIPMDDHWKIIEPGKLIIAGYRQDSPRQVNMQLWNWRGLDVINTLLSYRPFRPPNRRSVRTTRPRLVAEKLVELFEDAA